MRKHCIHCKYLNGKECMRNNKEVRSWDSCEEWGERRKPKIKRGLKDLIWGEE